MKLFDSRLKENRHLLAFFAYLLLFPLILIYFSNTLGYHSFDFLSLPISLGLVLLYLLVFAAFGAAGSLRASRGCLIGLGIVVGGFNFAELFFFIHFQSQARLTFLGLARATNWTEMLGFFQIYILSWKTLLLLLLYPVGGALLLRLGAQKHWGLPALAVLTLLGAPAFSLALKLRPDAENNRYGVMMLPVLIDQFLYEALDNQFMAEDLAAANAGLTAVNREEEALYVLVIGESHSKHRSSVYGFERDTTPQMRALAATGELLVFQDVTAPNSFTNHVLPKLLSFEAHDVAEKFFETPNIIDLMRAAGFKTYYLTNQANLSELGLTYMAIAARAEVFRSTMAVWRMSPDEALLPLFDEALADPGSRKKFIILHLIGNHSGYEATYPAGFRPFPLAAAPEFFNEQQRQNRSIVNHYDNSLRYGDHFLSLLIGELKASGLNGYLLYLPDHGENLYEEKDAILHMEFLPTRQTVEIPMYLYLTGEYRQRQPPGQSAAMADSLTRPWSSEDLPFLLLELSRVEYDGFDPAKSIINPAFQPKTRIVSKCRILYDKLKNATYEERISARNLR